jgi:hypothetical protein
MLKDPEEMVKRTIKGMLPKNGMRPDFLAKVSVYAEGCEEMERLKLPQFSPIKPIDYNKIFGLDKELTPENLPITEFRGDPEDCT